MGTLRLLEAIKICGLMNKVKFYQVEILDIACQSFLSWKNISVLGDVYKKSNQLANKQNLYDCMFTSCHVCVLEWIYTL